MAVLVIIFGFIVLKYAARLAIYVLYIPFKAIEIAAANAEKNRKERARRIETEQRERLRIEQAARREQERRAAADRREQREQEQREQRRIKAEREAVKWEWAQQREKERQYKNAWRECCNKSKMGLDYQNAVDDESYRRVRGTELYKLIELYENELFDAIDANNPKRIETAQKNLINTRRLLRENEKAVRTNQYNKARYKAYCSAAE